MRKKLDKKLKIGSQVVFVEKVLNCLFESTIKEHVEVGIDFCKKILNNSSRVFVTLFTINFLSNV